MADVEVSTQPIIGLEDGGFIVVVNDVGAPFRLPVADVEAATLLAGTAVQPGALGSAAYENALAFAPMSVVGDISAALDAILAGGD